MNRVLRRINEDLNLMERGITICVHQNQYNVRGAILAFVGDTLAAHVSQDLKKVLGLLIKNVESVSVLLRICRLISTRKILFCGL